MAESKKEEGNKYYKQKKYQEALKFYTGAIGNYIYHILFDLLFALIFWYTFLIVIPIMHLNNTIKQIVYMNV